MLVVFSAVFVAADPLMQLIDAGIGTIGDAAGAALADGPLRSLVVDGVIGGVGSVLVFLPQILILFFFLARAGRLRLHGPGGLPDGQADGPAWD